MLGSVSAVDEVNTVVLGSALAVGEAGSVVEVFASTAVVPGSVPAVVNVKARPVLVFVSSTAVVLGLVSAVVKVGTEVEVCSSAAVGSVSSVGEGNTGSGFGVIAMGVSRGI